MAGIITAFTTVFDAIGSWIATAFTDLIPIFYVASGESAGLTFMGTLAIMGLGISLVFLLVGIIQRFMHFAG